MIGFYGVHINGDIYDVYSPTNGKVSGKGGLSFGLNARRDFSEKIYGAFELRYMRKGSVYEFVSPYGSQAYESIVLHYIEVPLIFGYKVPVRKKSVLLEAGLVYGRLVSPEMSVSDLYQWDTKNIEEGFKKNELSLVAGIKYPVIKSEKLLVGFRIEHSLYSIHTQYDLYNFDYGVELYYLFNRNVR